MTLSRPLAHTGYDAGFEPAALDVRLGVGDVIADSSATSAEQWKNNRSAGSGRGDHAP
jgi:hypothetical protein